MWRVLGEVLIIKNEFEAKANKMGLILLVLQPQKTMTPFLTIGCGQSLFQNCQAHSYWQCVWYLTFDISDKSTATNANKGINTTIISFHSL
jgi:hypothetical protein